MNKATKIILGISLNAICAVVGIGLAGTADAGGLSCSQPGVVACDLGCGAWYEGPAFACCSTFGTYCCSRTCHQYECLEGPSNGPCNSALQTISTTGAFVPNTPCYQGNYCQNTSN
jgi:hypothetical protein